MSLVSAYLHALDGRVRIKVAEVKGCPEKAADVEERLLGLAGVDEVTANPKTGNVLVLYDPSRVSQDEIMDMLRAAGCFRELAPAHPIKPGVTFRRDTFADIVVRSSLEFALQRMIMAFMI